MVSNSLFFFRSSNPRRSDQFDESEAMTLIVFPEIAAEMSFYTFFSKTRDTTTIMLQQGPAFSPKVE